MACCAPDGAPVAAVTEAGVGSGSLAKSAKSKMRSSYKSELPLWKM